LTIDQLDKEFDDIVQNVNATLRDSTLKQDERYYKDITKLHRHKERLNLKLKYLREIDKDLTKEIDLCVKANKKFGVKIKDPNDLDEWNIHRDVKEILLAVSSKQIGATNSLLIWCWLRKPGGTIKDWPDKTS